MFQILNVPYCYCETHYLLKHLTKCKCHFEIIHHVGNEVNIIAGEVGKCFSLQKSKSTSISNYAEAGVFF